MQILFELIDKVCGTQIAENMDSIYEAFLMVCIFAGILLWGDKIKPFAKSHKRAETKEKPQRKYRRISKWYPSGWIFNEETKLWEPPDYLIKQSKEKWEWDEEKRIWIDKEKGKK